MKIIGLLCLLSIFCADVHAQKKEFVYNNPNDTKSDYYLAIYPDSTPYKGCLILIPALGETPPHVTAQTELPYKASEKGLLVIIPIFKTGIYSFGIDSVTQSSLDELIPQIYKKYKLMDEKLYIGGFSIGGSCAIQYARRSFSYPNLKKPTAVFAIDPPLDFERIYNAMKRNIRISSSKKPNPEASYLINRIKQVMGGTPAEQINNYYRFSPFSQSDTLQQAVKTLNNLPVEIVTEPDIEWQLSENKYDFYSMNALDGAAFINELRLAGNPNAILVTTIDKGIIKPGNQKNPHSWSIADPEKTLHWLLKF